MHELCNALDNCSRPKGHEGDHGHPIPTMPFVIFAPWPNTGEEQPSEECPLKCLDCSGVTRMQKTESGGSITCAGCDAVYTFGGGKFTQTIVKLFPSGDPHKYRDKLKSEFVAYFRAEKKFINEANYLFDLIDQYLFEKRLDNIEVAINDWLAEDAAFSPPKRWWQFWKGEAG